jgi:sporulation protein YlmC with PRC-barrel domain
MYKFTIARQLASKRVITNRGDEIGKLVDLLIDDVSGDLEYLLIEVDTDSKVYKTLNLHSKDRTIKVPYSAVSAVSDVFIVDEKQLTSEE